MWYIYPKRRDASPVQTVLGRGSARGGGAAMGDRRMGCQQDDCGGLRGEGYNLGKIMMDGDSEDGDEEEKVKRRR